MTNWVGAQGQVNLAKKAKTSPHCDITHRKPTLKTKKNFHVKYKTCAESVEVWTKVAESEVFGWSWSRIPNNTGSWNQIFLSDPDSGCPLGSFFASHS